MKLIRLFLLFALAISAQPKDIAGTWVAKMNTPMGEMEMVYQFQVSAAGKITGSQTMPMGDAPIVDGKITGDEFEFTTEQEMFGNVMKRVTKGKVTGDVIVLTPSGPQGPPPGVRPPGMGPGGPGGPGGPRMMMGPVTARRGTPTPSYRAPALDMKTLPVVKLPTELKELAGNGLAKTPPMGWNSWNKFRTKIDDKTVREIADALVSTGMRDAGYVYINIDDGWQWKRDERGVLLPNPGFPDMKALASYVHGKGLKLGIYSSPGPRTCGGFEGSYGHEAQDAQMWAEWGIDYLKYDWCSASRIWKDEEMRAAYQVMGEALQKTGRSIVYSLCQYGRAGVGDWGPKVGGNLWRTTFDIRDQWESMAQIGFSQHDWAKYSKPGQWNDPDMLEVGNGGMTAVEYRTHFSLWAMIASPLMAGNDLRAMPAETKEILTNREVIAVNQDKLGKGGARRLLKGEVEVWVKELEQGDVAVAFFNKGTGETEVSVTWTELGMAGAGKVRDLWRHQDLGALPELKAKVAGHGVVMWRVGGR